MLRGERQARLGRRAVLVFGDQPGGVVGGLEGMESVQEVHHGGEAVDPQQLFFESPDEALRDSVALRFPNKRRRGVSGIIDREGSVCQARGGRVLVVERRCRDGRQLR